MTDKICPTCGKSHPGLLHEKPPRPISKLHWYAVTVQPEMDERVAFDLAKQGFDVYLPAIHKRQRTANRAWVEIGLLLSPYVFVAIDEARPVNSQGQALNHKAIADTLGVAGFVSLSLDAQQNKAPSEFPADTIRGMRLDELDDRLVASRRVRRKESPFKAADEVVIRPDHQFWGGMRAKVKSSRPGAVWVEIEGCSKFPIRLDEDEVVPAAWAGTARSKGQAPSKTDSELIAEHIAIKGIKRVA